jgi:hypothetical protein
MKRFLSTILAVVLVALTFSFVAGPVTAFADDSATTQPSPRAKLHARAERLKAALAQLGLSADQQSKIDSIIADTKAKVKETIKSMKDSGSDRKAIREAIMPILKDAKAQIKAVLTADQLKQLHEILSAERKEHKTETK